MVQKKVYIELYAKDLKHGDLFAHWAVMEDGLYPEASRIHTIVIEKKNVCISLDDGRVHNLKSGMNVVVKDVA